jgi:hypothetical protein
MKIRRDEEGQPSLVFEDLEPFFVELLRRLPADADPAGHPAAGQRLYSDPITAAEDGDGFDEDWRNYVEPEIRELFQSAREMVAEDLDALPPGAGAELKREKEIIQFDPAAFAPGQHAFRIPDRHSEAWLSVLNQARLVIAAKRGFDEAAMEEEMPFPPFSERDLDLFKIHFFDLVQQILLREMGYE